MAAAGLTNLTSVKNTSVNRSDERVLFESQLSGELRLSGRNLKEFPKISLKYELSDTIVAGEFRLIIIVSHHMYLM